MAIYISDNFLIIKSTARVNFFGLISPQNNQKQTKMYNITKAIGGEDCQMEMVFTKK
jgi:hypothetical protein